MNNHIETSKTIAYQSDSITPSKPHSFRSTVLLIQPFAQDGVPLIASYAHLHFPTNPKAATQDIVTQAVRVHVATELVSLCAVLEMGVHCGADVGLQHDLQWYHVGFGHIVHRYLLRRLIEIHQDTSSRIRIPNL